MIIDTTVSVMESMMDRLRRRFCYEPGWQSGWHRPADRQVKIQYRKAAIRDFLIQQGKNPEQSSNCLAVWQDGKVIDVVCFVATPGMLRAKKEKELKKVLMPDEELQQVVHKRQPKAIYDRIPEELKPLILGRVPIPLG